VRDIIRSVNRFLESIGFKQKLHHGMQSPPIVPLANVFETGAFAIVLVKCVRVVARPIHNMLHTMTNQRGLVGVPDDDDIAVCPLLPM
jgi:hypothetical protein